MTSAHSTDPFLWWPPGELAEQSHSQHHSKYTKYFCGASSWSWRGSKGCGCRGSSAVCKHAHIKK